LRHKCKKKIFLINKKNKRINKEIIINIGYDIFVEMSVTKACQFFQERKKILKTKLIYVLELIKKNQIHFDKTESILNQLKLQIEIDK